ncbi:tetratricopeptide repeat protein [Brucepastera parasyntrophica]|uniref:tetratricopeptide repeat protein n=1 Tax=Brucepastera parasyntrophica TaxID=2880008 RepID=UPI00210C8055|nr:tetratricopeptide repeat protein [Brucepastera parasyntrophica]ULQ61213.1 tetratricopeptide repeat protein [Brucepastera parasyntrophica]
MEGRLHSRSGDFDRALAVFRKIIDTWPKDIRGWEEIALVYEKKNVPDMAAVFREKAAGLKKKK